MNDKDINPIIVGNLETVVVDNDLAFYNQMKEKFVILVSIRKIGYVWDGETKRRYPYLSIPDVIKPMDKKNDGNWK